MLKQMLCQAKFAWELSCEGPFLIADGRYIQDRLKEVISSQILQSRRGWYPDKFFVSTKDDQSMLRAVADSGRNAPEFSENSGFYVPGTSLRGPLRAQAERIVRTLVADGVATPVTACDPFQQQDESSRFYCCSKRLEAQNDAPPYARVCPACKMFGAAGLASRVHITDAAIGHGLSIYRDMIGIDRFTGGVFTGGGAGGGGANMRLHILENTVFKTTLTITNFELWHLGLLAYLFRDFEDGLIPIGYGKTKGFGNVIGRVSHIELSYCRPPNGIEHMGSLMAPEEAELYSVTMGEAPEFALLPSIDENALNWYERRQVADEQVNVFFQTVAPYFNAFITDRQREAA